jgi:branched-chain amino acid transport system substrate-binding protein
VTLDSNPEESAMNPAPRRGLLAVVFLVLLAVGCSGEVKVGAIISESGAVATYGRHVKNGLDLAAEQINAAGGVQGKQVVLVYRDDETKPDVGERVARELIEQEGIKIIIGAVSSPVTIRVAQVCEEDGAVLLSPSASAPEITELGDYIFRNYPSDIVEGTSMAVFARESDLEKIVIFALDNEFGRGMTEVFKEEFESRLRRVLKVFEVPSSKIDGFGEMVAEAKELKPDGIFIVTYDQALVGLLQEIKKAGIDATIMGTSSVPVTIARMAGDAAEGLIYPRSGFDPLSDDPVVAEFVRDYTAKYNEAPDVYAAHGYDALKLIAQAIKNGGTTHPDSVKVGLSAIKGFQGAAGQTTFDNSGDVVRYPRLYVVRDGQSVPYER